MKRQSVLEKMKGKSPLANETALGAKRHGTARQLIVSLSLTSLVDAFAILLIYLLLSNTGGIENMDIDPGIKLPMASQTELLKKTTIVKVRGGRYFLDDQELSISDLSTRLNQIRDAQPAEQDAEGNDVRPELIIQADKDSSFDTLDPVIKASSQVGFYVIKFAVIHEETL